MKWNTGDNAIALFTLLYAHGAEYIRNYYQVFPCQINAPAWIKPLGTGIERILGYRNITEFENTYEALKIKYALDDSKPLDISVGDDNEDGEDNKDGEEFDEDDYDPDPYAHCDHPDGCPTKSKCICACYNCNY